MNFDDHIPGARHDEPQYVPVDAQLLDDLISLAEAHVNRIERQRTTPANRLAKQQCRTTIERAKELLRDYSEA